MSKRNGILVSRTLYQLGVVTLIAAVIWTASGIYAATSKSEVTTKIDKAILDPINPTLDESVLTEMVSRLKVDNPPPVEIDIIETASPSADVTENATIEEAGGLR